MKLVIVLLLYNPDAEKKNDFGQKSVNLFFLLLKGRLNRWRNNSCTDGPVQGPSQIEISGQK